MNRHRIQSLSATLRAARRQRGASLLEVIAYLGIAAIVVLGAVSLLTSAFGDAQANRTLEEVVSIRTGVKRLYMGQAATYTNGDLTVQAFTAGIMPATLQATNTGTTNAWAGAVKITGAASVFTISYALVPQAACISVLSGASGWKSIQVDATTAISVFPVTPAAATTACAATTSTITWTAT